MLAISGGQERNQERELISFLSSLELKEVSQCDAATGKESGLNPRYSALVESIVIDTLRHTYSMRFVVSQPHII